MGRSRAGDDETAEGPKTKYTGYQLRKVIGRGGFGEVWEASQMALGRTIAVKRLAEKGRDGSSRVQGTDRWLEVSFRQEALTTANLEHPNIVPVYDLGKDDAGRNILAMKLVRGKNWDALMKEDAGLLDYGTYVAKNVGILLDVCNATAFAHSRGIIHRDLKPSQVMVGEFGEVLLMDWGLAMVFDDNRLPGDTVQAFGELIPSRANASNPAGTISFMAPEQATEGADGLGPWTDIYLLGGILYFILCGKPPHEAPNTNEAFEKARTGEYRPLRDRRSDVPEDLERTVARALSVRPEDRFASVREFKEELESYLKRAGNRKQSIEITLKIRSLLENNRGDYKEYSEWLAELASASALWQGNLMVAGLREKVLAAYVRDALANRDLMLAQLHVEMLEKGEVKSELLLEVESLVREIKAESRRRSVSLMTAYTVLVAFTLLAGVYVFSLRGTVERQAQEIRALQAKSPGGS